VARARIFRVNPGIGQWLWARSEDRPRLAELMTRHRRSFEVRVCEEERAASKYLCDDTETQDAGDAVP
jgi:hypothetical protein